ncbi:glycosyltransferase family 4 protein [Aquimarina rhabdastrellae]
MKKVLIIAYYWPPAGGPGVQRWLKFVKYFRDFDIEPVVYVPENPTYPMIDKAFEKEIPDGITVIKNKINEPYRFASIFSKKNTKSISSGIIADQKKQSLIQRILLYIRGNFFVPDARVLWVKPSIKFLEHYLLNEGIDTVITTGPPHSIHLIGLGLKKGLDIHWYADFRDPWTTIGYHDKLKLSKRAALKHKTLEKEVLSVADDIIVTSFTTKKEFETITDRPIHVITNGYDDEKVIKGNLDDQFTFSHIGSLLSERNPKMLWKAFAAIINENQAFAAAFKLQLVGTVSEEVIQSIKEAGLASYLELKGYVPHDEAIQIQHDSQVLLLIEIDSEATRCIIPGKLFEYMASGRPIFAIGPDKADIFKIIEETKSGISHRYNEYEEIKRTILSYFKLYKEGKLGTHSRNITQYSRKALTKKLASLLKRY